MWESWQQKREAVWLRRDPRPHLLSTGSLAEGGSTSSLSAGRHHPTTSSSFSSFLGQNHQECNFADVLSPGGGLSLSMDEGLDSDQLSDGDSSDEGKRKINRNFHVDFVNIHNVDLKKK
jgi:hypothetical protein